MTLSSSRNAICISQRKYGDYYCLNFFPSFLKRKLQSHEEAWKYRGHIGAQIPKISNKILKHTQGQKFIKIPFIIYADIEWMLQKTHVCLNHPKNLSTTKVIKHTACGYAFSTKFSFHGKNINLIYKVVKIV